MKNLNTRWHPLAFTAIIALFVTGGVLAQLQTGGDLYGRVTDEQGQRLSGVTLTLSGPSSTRVLVSDEDGQFHFTDLEPGRYKLNAHLEGFETMVHDISIRVGRDTTIEIKLSPVVERTDTAAHGDRHD